jgi:CDP-diacylglycerol---glycerol-3-phosphate 3-phosphatidyltransferase
MFTDTARQASRRIVEPIAQAMGRLGLTPNAVTVIGCLLHLLVVWPLAVGHPGLAAVMLALAAAFDGFDGTLARLTGRVSLFGAFLDSTLDRVSEVLVFAGLLLYVPFAGDSDRLLSLLVLLGLAGSLMTSYTRARSEAIGHGTKGGVFGRFERMALLVIGLLLTAWFGPLWFNLTLWVLVIGAWLTTFLRVYDVWQGTRRNEA